LIRPLPRGSLFDKPRLSCWSGDGRFPAPFSFQAWIDTSPIFLDTRSVNLFAASFSSLTDPTPSLLDQFLELRLFFNTGFGIVLSYAQPPRLSLTTPESQKRVVDFNVTEYRIDCTLTIDSIEKTRGEIFQPAS